MKLSDFYYKSPIAIVYELSGYSIKHLSDTRYINTIDYEVYLESRGKNLQRDFCWTPFQKNQLILSVFKEVKIPSLTVLESRSGTNSITLKVIDGKQRLSTLLDFYQDKIPFIWKGDSYKYSELPTDMQKFYSRFQPKINIGYEYYDNRIPDDDLINWFEHINFLGTPQDLDHLHSLKGN